MPHFHRDKPHSEVHGIVGVRYLQAGHTFNSSGEHVVDPEAGMPQLDPGKTVTDTKVPAPEDYPLMKRTEDGDYVEAAQERMAESEQRRTPEITPIATSQGQPLQPSVVKDDMRLKENKVLKIQWEQYHDGEEWPGVAEAKRILGVT